MRKSRHYLLASILLFSCMGPSAFSQVWTTQREDVYWVVIREDDGSPFPTKKQEGAENRLEDLGHFYARNSGGLRQYDLAAVLDAPIALDPDGSRPDGWGPIVKGNVLQEYGIDLEAMKHGGPGVAVFDLGLTKKNPGQSWGGLASQGGEVLLQNTGRFVTLHEFGHVLGFGHTKGYRGNRDFHYQWDPISHNYVRYVNNNGVEGHLPMPYGVKLSEYGHENSVMGTNGSGDLPVFMKRNKNWLANSTNETLDLLTANNQWTDSTETIRLYAHNDLETLVTTDALGRPHYGVQQGYDQSLTYSIEFSRDVMIYDADAGQFEPKPQIVMLEYFVETQAEAPGIYAYLKNDGRSWGNIDINPGNDWQIHENNTDVFSEHQLGTSLFSPKGDEISDFLELAPLPPPTDLEVRPEWFTWQIVNKGETGGRHWLDLEFQVQSIGTTVVGDFNTDNVIDLADWETLRSNLLTEVTNLGITDRWKSGDTNLDGLVDLLDFSNFRTWYDNAYGSGSFAATADVVPEPSLGLLIALALLAFPVRWQASNRC